MKIDIKAKGLSPRSRGRPRATVTLPDAPGSIPAVAGETSRPRMRPRSGRVYPRGRGGDFRLQGFFGLFEGLSPRSRGRPPSGATTIKARGSIPAVAGETVNRYPLKSLRRVYPRGRGGDSRR